MGSRQTDSEVGSQVYWEKVDLWGKDFWRYPYKELKKVLTIVFNWGNRPSLGTCISHWLGTSSEWASSHPPTDSNMKSEVWAALAYENVVLPGRGFGVSTVGKADSNLEDCNLEGILCTIKVSQRDFQYHVPSSLHTFNFCFIYLSPKVMFYFLREKSSF